LRHPFLVLEQIAKLAKQRLVIETHIDALDVSRPAMIFYPGKELANDETNWWGPNIPCVEAMLRDCGFRHVEVFPDNTYGARATFIGTRL
jgi:tRNA (mo5U34)-methyltransferase